MNSQNPIVIRIGFILFIVIEINEMKPVTAAGNPSEDVNQIAEHRMTVWQAKWDRIGQTQERHNPWNNQDQTTCEVTSAIITHIITSITQKSLRICKGLLKNPLKKDPSKRKLSQMQKCKRDKDQIGTFAHGIINMPVQING